MRGFYRQGLEVRYITSCQHSIGQESVTWEAGKCSLPGSEGGNRNRNGLENRKLVSTSAT